MTLVVGAPQAGFGINDMQAVPERKIFNLAAAAACACSSDLDDDGFVGITDFLALLVAWGANHGHPADFDGDGIVGITDFLLLLSQWGPCP